MKLGDYIKEMRQKRNVTVKQVLERSNLDCSVTLFSQWENNRRVPTPNDLKKLCEIFGMNEKIAFFLWAQAHMPSEDLKKIFSVRDPEGKEFKEIPKTFSSPFDLSVYPAASTIRIQERDLPFFTKNIEAATVLMRALVAGTIHHQWWPLEKIIEDLDLTKERALKIIKELKKMGFIKELNGKYRTPEEIDYVYAPETEDFEVFRKARIQYTFRRLIRKVTLAGIKSGEVFRVNLGSRLTAQQRKEFIADLRSLSNKFLSMHAESRTNPEARYYQFIGLLGLDYDN